MGDLRRLTRVPGPKRATVDCALEEIDRFRASVNRARRAIRTVIAKLDQKDRVIAELKKEVFSLRRELSAARRKPRVVIRYRVKYVSRTRKRTVTKVVYRTPRNVAGIKQRMALMERLLKARTLGSSLPRHGAGRSKRTIEALAALDARKD